MEIKGMAWWWAHVLNVICYYGYYNRALLNGNHGNTWTRGSHTTTVNTIGNTWWSIWENIQWLEEILFWMYENYIWLWRPITISNELWLYRHKGHSNLVTIVQYNLAAVWMKWMEQLTLIDDCKWVGSGMRGNKAYLICTSPDHMHTSVLVTNTDICDAASLQVTWSYCTSPDHIPRL